MRINGRFQKELYPWEQFLTVRVQLPYKEYGAAYDTSTKFIRRLLENSTFFERFKGRTGPTYYFILTDNPLDQECVYQAAESVGIQRDCVHIDCAEVIPTEDLPPECIHPKGLLIPNTYLIDFFSHSWFDAKANNAFA